MKKLIQRPIEVFLLMLTSTLLGCDIPLLIAIYHFHIIKETMNTVYLTIFVPVTIIMLWVCHFLIRAVNNNIK